MEETGEQPHQQIKHRKRIIVVLVCLSVALLTVVTFLIFSRRPSQPQFTNGFPNTAISQVKGFKLYYLKPGFSTDYTLQTQTISYGGGLLVFNMKDPLGKTLAFTEQATPPGYDISGLQADKQFNNEFGQAFITDATDRTTGALFTQNGSWILINSPQPIGSDLMQQILDALVPVNMPSK